MNTKLSVVGTLFHRADTVVTNPDDKDHEIKHVKTAPKHCGYKDWSFKRACVAKKDQITTNNQDSAKTTKYKTNVVIPYVQGVSEQIKRVFGQYGASAAFKYVKPLQTLRQILVAPKGKHRYTEEKAANVVYRAPL